MKSFTSFLLVFLICLSLGCERQVDEVTTQSREITQGSVQSTLNTTTTPLGSSATYTGTFEQNGYPDALISCQTDNSGTLYFDFSVDGTNYTTFPTAGFAVSAGIHEIHKAVKGPRYFRVRLVNDSGAQSYLRLYTYFGHFADLNAPLNQVIGRDSDAVMVRVLDPQDEISIGQRSGVSNWEKFGFRGDLDTADSDALVIADDSTNSPEILTSAETFDIAYTQADDGSSSNGALTLTFFYLDGNGEFAIATHTLGNDGSDTTSFSGLGINRVAVSSSGSTDTNGNNITITSTTTGGVQAYIPTGLGVTQQAIFHVPHNARGLLKHLYINANKLSGGGTPRVVIKGWIHDRNIDTKFEVFRHTIDTSAENTLVFSDTVNFNLNPSDILYFTASTTVDNTIVVLRFGLNVYED